MIVFIGGALLVAEAAAQQEIATFKLTNIQGVLSTGYLLQDRRDERFGASNFSQTQELWGELAIRTRSYLYHPAFLDIVFSGGPRFLQRSNQRGTADSSFDGTLFSYDLRLNFLNRKPYSHSIFASSVNPESGTGLAGRFRTKSTSYGIQGSVPVRLLPNAIYWSASHGESEGVALGTIEDVSSDQASMRTVLPFLGGLNFALEWGEQDSRRGSPGLPINETQNENLSSQLSGNTEFGSERQYRLSQYMLHGRNKTTSPGIPETRSFRYSGNLVWSGSSRLGLSGTYGYNNVLRGSDETLAQNLTGGMNYIISNGLRFNGNARWSDNENVGLSRNSVGLRARLTYNRQTPIGGVTVTGSGGLGRTKQEAFKESVGVFDEIIALIGVERVALQEEFVLENSIVVTNTDRTQTYVEGLDYRVIVIGSTTSIERIANGNIFDGQQVFVSYDYETGGTVEYGSTSQSLSVGLALPKYTSFSLTLAKSDNEVLSGEATNPLNDSTRFEVRGSVDYPSRRGFTIGGEVRHVRNDETISPFVSTRYDAYLQIPQLRNTRVRLEFNAQTVDYEVSREGVDRKGYSIVVNTRIPAGIVMTYRGSIYEDGGGSVSRDSERHYLILGWRYRLLDFSLNALKSSYSQGSTGREDTEVNMQFRRFF
jgi:hypothetical protein